MCARKSSQHSNKPTPDERRAAETLQGNLVVRHTQHEVTPLYPGGSGGGQGGYERGYKGDGGGGFRGDLDLDLDLGANLKAHRMPGVTDDGAPDGTAYRPAMPYDALAGPSTDHPVAPSTFPG